eukprot:1185626-Prorocentrum_minimum.AAC.4
MCNRKLCVTDIALCSELRSTPRSIGSAPARASRTRHGLPRTKWNRPSSHAAPERWCGCSDARLSLWLQSHLRRHLHPEGRARDTALRDAESRAYSAAAVRGGASRPSLTLERSSGAWATRRPDYDQNPPVRKSPYP